MCLQALQVCDVYAALTFSTRPGAFCSSRVTSRPHPDLRMPRLRPAFWATFLPGFSMVPRAVRVMALTLRLSTRITSKRVATSVLVFSTQSLRRSPSLAFNPPIRVFTFLRRFDPRRARASRRGSNRRRKVKTLIGQLKARDADRRKDWVEKTSTDLATRFDVIRVENLNVKSMTR